MADTGMAQILLVEDDPRDAELTLHALKRCGLAHRVEHVTDGEAALEYVSSAGQFPNSPLTNLPRLILLDLRLHKMGGLHVLRLPALADHAGMIEPVTEVEGFPRQRVPQPIAGHQEEGIALGADVIAGERHTVGCD